MNPKLIMMNSIKRLKNKLNESLLILSALMIFSCSEEAKKEDYIARVNDSYLTREEFASLVDTSKLLINDKNQVISNWIYQELMYQKAKEKGITDNELYKNILVKSKRELAAAMLFDDYVKSEEVSVNESELSEYYEKNKFFFKLNLNSYLINKVTFRSEDTAIKFRNLAIESEWNKALNVFNKDKDLTESINSELVGENDIYPVSIVRIARDLFPKEISIVIAEDDGYYSVVQLLAKYQRESVPPYEIIKSKVTERYKAEAQRKMITNYIKEIYSESDIEIKNEF